MQNKYDELKKYNTEVVAISVDSVEKNKQVREKLGLEFEILSDVDREATKNYHLSHDTGTSQGIIPRPAEYLIDANGKIIYAWLTDSFQVRTKVSDILTEVQKIEKK